jgi:hypothetical protein
MSHQQNIQTKEHLLQQKEIEVQKIYKQLVNMRQHHRVKITDHALVRYMERICRVQINTVHDQLVTEQVLKYYAQLGDGTYPTGHGLTRVVIKDGVIVTVIN